MEEPDLGTSTMMLEVEVPSIITEQFSRFNTVIQKLEKDNQKLRTRNKELEAIFERIRPLRTAILDVAQHLDPWLFDDE